MKTKGVTQRESNFELLRIVAMLGIIMYHLVLHYIDYSRFALVNLDKGSNYYHLETIQIIYTFGQIGNTLFILITGYFLIKKSTVNVVKPGGKLLNRSYLLSIVLLCVAYLLGRFHMPVSTSANMHMPLNGWWFIGYYIFIIVFAKFFLNEYLNKLDKQGYLNFIVIMLVLLSFSEIFNILTNLKIQNFAIGISVYAIGGFIRLYNPLKNVKTLTLLLFIIIFMLIQVIQYKLNLNVNIRQFYQNGNSMYVNSPFNNVLRSPSILFLICSVSIFELFRRIKIGNIRVINTLSAATFTVYLFHESHFFKSLQFKGNPLPNRLRLLRTVSTKVIAEDPTKEIIVPLDDPESWQSLKDFLNISQVFQERGVKIGLMYMILLTITIFIVGVFFEFLLQMINRGFRLIFSKDLNALKRSLR
ncbi:acyltransferase family protein [Enterococcus sp. AZ192]|uniref:acyltransferase family protein n=1 Tax=unclassified Enterococcus TaxID=2608891 RepID=UPI003D2C2692